MVTPTRPLTPKQELKLIVRRIVEAYAPEKIILYGSYAYGTPHPDSDFDLLILKETTETPRERRFVVRKAIWTLPTTIPVEPLVVTQAELARRLEIGDQFFQEIVSQGKTLYDRQRIARPRRMVRLCRSRLRGRKDVAQRPR
jgi:predicted nucleotidyltransferase